MADRIYKDNVQAAISTVIQKIVAGLRDGADATCTAVQLPAAIDFEFAIVMNRANMTETDTQPAYTVTRVEHSPTGDVVERTVETHEGKQIQQNTQDSAMGGQNVTTADNWWHSVDDSVILPPSTP